MRRQMTRTMKRRGGGAPLAATDVVATSTEGVSERVSDLNTLDHCILDSSHTPKR